MAEAAATVAAAATATALKLSVDAPNFCKFGSDARRLSESERLRRSDAVRFGSCEEYPSPSVAVAVVEEGRMREEGKIPFS